MSTDHNVRAGHLDDRLLEYFWEIPCHRVQLRLELRPACWFIIDDCPENNESMCALQPTYSEVYFRGDGLAQAPPLAFVRASINAQGDVSGWTYRIVEGDDDKAKAREVAAQLAIAALRHLLGDPCTLQGMLAATL